jgi:hypothetical protein
MNRTLDNIFLTRREFYREAKRLARARSYQTLRRWQAMIPLFEARYRELLSVGKLPLWKFQLRNAELHRKADLYAQAIDFQTFPNPIPNCPRPDYYDSPEMLLSLVSAPVPPSLLNADKRLKLLSAAFKQ